MITGSGSWFETGWATWSSVAGASGYAVSYKPSSGSTWTPVDAALIRGNRVDIPGLQGNVSYDIRVSATGTSTIGTTSVTTASFDRSGFAFVSGSPNGTTTGAYQANGTVAAGTAVLYINDANKDTVQMAVTKGTTTATYTGLGAIMAARTSAKSTVPLIVRFFGKVNRPAGLDSNQMLTVKDQKNLTFEGIGNDVEMDWGFNVVRTTNIVFRNIYFYMFYEDSVSFQDNCFNAWVHNIDFGIGQDRGGDKSLGDGSCDIKASSSYITVAYNHFQGTGKSSLIGLNESSEFFISYHHNYFQDVGSRGPRVRTGTIHVYNNFYQGQKTYGIGAAEGSSIFVQNNYFENSNRPMIIASQGHDIGTDGGSTLSGENGGTIKASGNFMDAVSASTFTAGVDTGNAQVGGAVYNNFDANFAAIGYQYQLDTAEGARTKALQNSGRMN